MDVAVIGLGHVGLTLAISFTQAGVKVTGIEASKEKIKQIINGSTSVLENDLEKFTQDAITQGNLIISDDISKITEDVIIISVGTPLTVEGRVDNSYLQEVIQSLKQLLKGNEIIILRSTVKVGATTEIYNEINKLFPKVGIAFCPERTIEGNAISEIKNLPQIISGNSSETIARVKEVFLKITNDIIVARKFEVAESAKLYSNIWRDTIFGIANEISLTLSYLGLNPTEVINLANYNYPRNNIPLPGPVGGPCLSKDTHILKDSLNLNDKNPNLLKISLSARELNRNYSLFIFEKIVKKLNINFHDLKVLFLGISFKGQPASKDWRGSPIFPMIESCISNKIAYRCWDPHGESVEFSKSSEIIIEDNLEKGLREANLIIVQNNDTFFTSKEFADCLVNIKNFSTDKFIFDFWDRIEIASNLNVKQIRLESIW
jgi:nucleotide sugar dehydrogenase